MCYITVCTPTYNRAYCLERPFNSLLRQTFKDFEWIVIDDGSTDNTSEIIEGFKKKAEFKIVYVKQSNKGRAAALNESYNHIKSKYVINLDSDDELVPDALQKIHDIWENIPQEDYDRFWCISGQCIDSQTKNLVSGVWPQGINELKGKRQRKKIIKYKKGEKSCCRKLEILQQFPFPQLPDTKFVPEDMVWERINKKFDQYCTNEVFRIYYKNSSDSLSSGKGYNLTRKFSYYHLTLMYLNDFFDEFFYNKTVRLSILHLPRLAILTKKKYKTTMKQINKWYKRLLVSLSWPFIYLFVKIYYRNKF